MSTNKTTNYRLHSWEPGDDFLRTEINENFEAIDTALAAKAAQSDLSSLQTAVGAKAQIVCGSYTGNGTTPRTISLGFRPKALFLVGSGGTFGSESGVLYGGMLVDGVSHGNYTVSLAAGGFVVYQANYAAGNRSNSVYMYLALR